MALRSLVSILLVCVLFYGTCEAVNTYTSLTLSSYSWEYFAIYPSGSSVTISLTGSTCQGVYTRRDYLPTTSFYDYFSALSVSLSSNLYYTHYIGVYSGYSSCTFTISTSSTSIHLARRLILGDHKYYINTLGQSHYYFYKPDYCPCDFTVDVTARAYDPDLYIKTSSFPTTTSYDYRSIAVGSDSYTVYGYSTTYFILVWPSGGSNAIYDISVTEYRTNHNNSSDIGGILGAVFGNLFLFIIIVVVAVYCYRRQKQRRLMAQQNMMAAQSTTVVTQSYPGAPMASPMMMPQPTFYSSYPQQQAPMGYQMMPAAPPMPAASAPPMASAPSAVPEGYSTSSVPVSYPSALPPQQNSHAAYL